MSFTKNMSFAKYCHCNVKKYCHCNVEKHCHSQNNCHCNVKKHNSQNNCHSQNNNHCHANSQQKCKVQTNYKNYQYYSGGCYYNYTHYYR